MGLEEMIKEALIIADRHTPAHSERCDKILKEYIENNKKRIEYFVDLGDCIDNPYMSTFPVDPYWKDNPQEEFDAYAEFIKEVQDIIPKANYIILAGNHDKGRLSNAKNLNRGLASLRNLEYENVMKNAFEEAGVKTRKVFLEDGDYDLHLTKSNTVTITHGDPRLNPYIKGGVTGTRRTAEMYPNQNDLIMGHKHKYEAFSRNFPGKICMVTDGIYDIEKMKSMYLAHHPYTNGFVRVLYDKKADKRWIDHISIEDGVATIDGKIYKG